MNAIEILRAASRSVPNEDYVQFMAAVDAVVALVEAAREASATLGHIYHTTPLPQKLEQYAHDGYQRLDAAIAKAKGESDGR